MTIFLSEHDAARLGIAGAAPRTKRGRNTRPDIPSAGRSAPTGLGTLLLAGWNWEYRVGAGYRAYKHGLSSGWHATEKEACAAAKELMK